ncbi:DUF397 domain-containing protein [Solihabitans fulvus]|uniref:DUF397 domain-containing protein n=1 Tax=Solihabitans fulvus TaxID=1892852 RepID=A0A5B2XW96_9PSEU|nr:DUF397 domain-containing protein [Solihabitans fulvus]KAA2266964.1 DUF397 domain-containing protein [Solihabitans fulvus]
MSTSKPASNGTWRTSSRSGENGSCVAVRFPTAGPIGVRDSKNPDGPTLSFAASELTAFLTAIKTDRLVP